MQVGNSITLDNHKFIVRKFSAAEVQRWEEISEQHDLEGLEAKAQAAATVEPGTSKREQLVTLQMNSLNDQLMGYFTEDGSALKPDLTDDERAEAYGIALKIDMLENKIQDVRADHQADLIKLREKSIRAQQAAMVEFMHWVLQRDGYAGTFEDFKLSLGSDDYDTLEQVVSVGKLRLPLSALLSRHERESQASFQKAMKMLTNLEGMLPNAGTTSGSKRTHPALRGKTGKKRH